GEPLRPAFTPTESRGTGKTPAGAGVRDQAIRKSSRCLPLEISSAIQRGCLPRPVQVCSAFAGLRYFGGTLTPVVLRGARGALVARGSLAAEAAPPPNSSALV